MVNLSLNIQHADAFVSQDEIMLFQQEVNLHRHDIYHRKGRGSDFLGWVDLPGSVEESLFSRIEAEASRIRQQSEVVVIVGIGGSYLGTRAVCEALSATSFPIRDAGKEKQPELVYAGHHLDEDYLHKLLKWLDDKAYSIIVVSKSGTTTEPAIAFRLLRAHLEKKYGRKAASGRIIAITDAARGALKTLAGTEGYASYTIPDDVGGRYSVLTPVGLLPIAVAGHDIRSLIRGANQMAHFLKQEDSLSGNPAALYAVARTLLYRKGKTIEILASYNPALVHLTEWWKQLFGESEGKEGKGIFPAGVSFTTDLHSMGQYIQDGLKNFFETVITVQETRHQVVIPHEEEDLDGLNYLAGKRVGYVNRMAGKGTMMAHLEGGVPNLELTVPHISEEILGELIYFFEMACAISGYMLDVNPFDQPGVEAYKKNMFRLLGKPGA
ncbi:MAG: glucose-6-phosphate isomerase [Bacteroidales bacterium]|nr:glucose-6-phosphate isomerase [Bacteroidales bacterium]